MLDNALLTLIVQVIQAGQAGAGLAGIPISQFFQPTEQGVNTQATIYIQKIPVDHRYGSTGRTDVWDTDDEEMVHTETQQYESMFQLSALATQNPATPDQMTAADICNLCSAILSSSASIATFQAQGVGIERITDVRNPYFRDDREQFEASPSFDFMLTHKQILTSTVPIIQSTEFRMKEV